MQLFKGQDASFKKNYGDLRKELFGISATLCAFLFLLLQEAKELLER